MIQGTPIQPIRRCAPWLSVSVNAFTLFLLLFLLVQSHDRTPAQSAIKLPESRYKLYIVLASNANATSWQVR